MLHYKEKKYRGCLLPICFFLNTFYGLLWVLNSEFDILTCGTIRKLKRYPRAPIFSPSRYPVASFDLRDTTITLTDYAKAKRDWDTIYRTFYDEAMARMKCANCDWIHRN